MQTLIEEEHASDLVREIYDKIKTGLQIDFVPNFFKALAVRPDILHLNWEMMNTIFLRGVLPRTLKELIYITLSKANGCEYCTTAHLAFCKIMGLGEHIIHALLHNIEDLQPIRTREIIKIVLRLGKLPVVINPDDLAKLEQLGITPKELQELISVISLINYHNSTIDILQIPVDAEFLEVVRG
ncbi:MAG: carboxymuconolactone decarboxylase family protein [Chlamydiales bacterium]